MKRSSEEAKRILKELGIYSTKFSPRRNPNKLDDLTKQLLESADLFISDTKVKIYAGEDLTDEEIHMVRACAYLLFGQGIIIPSTVNSNNSRNY